MTAAGSVYDLLPKDPALLGLIKLKSRALAEMLKDLAIIIGNCDIHLSIPPLVSDWLPPLLMQQDGKAAACFFPGQLSLCRCLTGQFGEGQGDSPRHRM